MPGKNIADSIQNVLEKNKGFMKVKDVISLMSLDDKRQLCPKVKKPSDAAVTKRLESVLADRFRILKCGSAKYIFIPCLPSDIVMSFVQSLQPVSPKVLVKSLPFTKSQFAEILSELEVAGKVISIYDEKLEPRIIINDTQNETQPALSEEYTREKFKSAFDSLDRGRIFVRICDLRRRLGWPREIFDGMIRDLRDDETIQLHTGDASLMTPDEVADCFIDENNFRKGSVTWNV